MISLAAFSAAGVLLQFIQFGLELFSASKEIYESSANTSAGATDVQFITQYWIFEMEKVQATLASQPSIDKHYEHLCSSCLELALELSQILKGLKVQGKHKKWESLKAAIRVATKKEEIEKLSKRFDILRQEINNYRIIQALEDIIDGMPELKRNSQTGISGLSDLTQMIQEFDKNFTKCLNGMSKQLGYVWETGTPKDHIWIDDGLRPPFLVPSFFCSSHQRFVDLIQHTWTHSEELPGNFQISNHHYELLDWKESSILHESNWDSIVGRSHGIKLSFIMGIWHGIPKDRCPRCRKPRNTDKSSLNYRKCHSCKLALRQVDSAAYMFEPEDISFCLGDYWKFRKQRKLDSSQSHNQIDEHLSNPAKTEPLAIQMGLPPIDFVCRRITMKWEPIFNIVCRYSLCRCIIWRSTPLSFYREEMTLLFASDCPRHNKFGIGFRDYGNHDYNKDPYFDQFGGYESFRLSVSLLWPKILDFLGGEKFTSNNEIQNFLTHTNNSEYPESLDISCHNESKVDEGILRYIDKYNDYLTDHYEALILAGLELPEPLIADMKSRRGKSREGEELKRQFDKSPTDWKPSKLPDHVKTEEFPHLKGVREIFDRNWSGKPHWVVED